MAKNTFSDDPLKLVMYDPINNKILNTKIFVNCPKNVLNAVRSGNGAVLKSYFGSDWRRKLSAETEIQEHVEAVGGDYTDDIEQLLNDTATTDDAGIGNAISDSSTGVSTGNDTIDESDTEKIHRVGVRKSQSANTQSVSTRALSPQVEYITNVKVYPEDKFSELRAKIFLASGVPPYRQHLFYYDRGRLSNMYKLYAQGLYQVNIRELGSRDKILDIPIDRNLYDLRDEIRVESLEDFQLVGDYLHDKIIYCVDLALFIRPLMTQLVELVNDSYRTELFYYGFVIKYWPIIVRECFNDFILDESSLGHKYPELAPARNLLLQRYTTEADLIDYNYINSNRAFNMAESSAINMAIVQMTAMVNTPRISLNIRNLFDKLRVTRCIPELHAYVEHAGKKYMLRKTHNKNASDIQFPLGTIMKSGITIAVSLHKQDQDSYHSRKGISTSENEQSRYLFLNIQPNGKYYIRSIWNEEDELGFDNVIRLMKKFVDPIINGINKLGKYVFVEGAELNVLSRLNTQYQSLNMCIFWKKVMLETTFKTVKQLWESYLRAGIIAPRNIQQFDKYEFTFCKGMYDFDANIIESIITASHNIILNNYYSHLSNSGVKQKWNQNYEGRIVRMSHRTTDVRFEILSVREQEFTIFYRYIVLFIYRAQHDANVISSMQAVRNYKDVKRLRKLREQDPELYNIKKYGSEKTYSVLCQKPKQPLIYTQDEIKTLPQTEVKKLTQYWNFTLNKTAYYGCPNRKFPHLTFITGIHPKHYCLPCCGQTSNRSESKKARMISVCMSKHKYIIGDTPAGISRHIMSYGKDVDLGRLSKIPLSVKNLLFNTLDSPRTGYYLFGVSQHFPAINNVGIVYAVAEAFDVTPNQLLSDLLNIIRASPEKIFQSSLGGSLSEYFSTSEDFLMSLKELFIDGKIISHEHHRFTQWADLFVELFQQCMYINIFMLIDESGTGESVNIYLTDLQASEMKHKISLEAPDGSDYMFVVKKVNKYYPLFVIDIEKYTKNLEIAEKKFKYDDSIVQLVYQMIKYSGANVYANINQKHNLICVGEFCEKSDYSIVTQYVNRQNLCYAVQLQGPHGSLYVPIDYSVYIAGSLPVSFDRPAAAKTATVVMEFVQKFNEFITQRYRVSNEMYTYELLHVGSSVMHKNKFIGLMINRMIFYCDSPATAVSTVVSTVVSPATAITTILHDYRDINELIINRVPPVVDNRQKMLGESLYNNYKYQLLVLEFVTYLESERNTTVRAEISKLLLATNFKKDTRELMNSLHKLLANVPNDFNLIQKQLSEYYYVHQNKTKLQDDIAGSVYEFDRLTLNRLRGMPVGEIVNQLRSICKNFVTEREFDTSGLKFPNIYLPCSAAENDYCADGKLLLNTSLEEYIDILAHDVKDDLRSKYLVSGVFADTVLSYLQFTIVPTETITIHRLTE